MAKQFMPIFSSGDLQSNLTNLLKSNYSVAYKTFPYQKKGGLVRAFVGDGAGESQDNTSSVWALASTFVTGASNFFGNNWHIFAFFIVLYGMAKAYIYFFTVELARRSEAQEEPNFSQIAEEIIPELNLSAQEQRDCLNIAQRLQNTPSGEQREIIRTLASLNTLPTKIDAAKDFLELLNRIIASYQVNPTT